MEILNDLEANLIHVKSADENPTPIAETICLMSVLYDLVTKECDTLTPAVVQEMEKRLWQLVVVYQPQLQFSFYHMGNKQTMAIQLFLILSRVIILRHQNNPDNDKQTCKMIDSLDPETYLPALANKPVATFTLRECVDSITILGTSFVNKHFHTSIQRYLSLLSYRLSEFCHFMMPYQEYQDVDFCNLVEQNEQSMGVVTFEFINRVYIILYHMYFRLQAVYIRPMVKPTNVSKTLIAHLKEMISDQVSKLVSAESGKTMREKYIASQMRPGEREMFMLSDVKKTGYEDDQQIVLHFRGEAEFSRMFEYCQKPWASIVKDELETIGEDETVGMQMCLFDLLCMFVKNQKISRTDLEKYMIWEADIPKKYAELVSEQNQTPFMVQVFNGIQLVYKNKMYMFNSLVCSFIRWVDIMANPPDDDDDDEDDEEMMGQVDRIPGKIKAENLSEQLLWKRLYEGRSEASMAHRRPVPKGYIPFKM